MKKKTPKTNPVSSSAVTEEVMTPKVELRSVESLIPYVNNARTHSEDQISDLAGSVEEFGMVGAVVVRDGVIAKGHATVQAIRKIYAAGKLIYPPPGQKNGAQPYPAGTVPVIDATGWSNSQFKGYVLADNRQALSAGWDIKLVKLELQELKLAEFPIEKIGFSKDELKNLLFIPPVENSDADAVPAVPDKPKSKRGDIWLLGAHAVCPKCGKIHPIG